ncbi:MAG: DsrE family protein [Arenicellales bacterium]
MIIKPLLRSSIFVLLILAMVSPAWSDDTKDNWEKMVFHLDETVNARWALMLANSYLEDSPNVKIVIVAFGPGVDFLIEDAEDRNGNPYDAAVMELSQKGIEFRVCANTLNAKNIAKERILDDATIVPSGLSEIARLQLKEGYAYLKP